jgi:hypothetical protein
LLAMEAMDR